MPVNVNPKTGYAYGALSMHRCAELAEELYTEACNVVHADDVTETRAELTARLGALELLPGCDPEAEFKAVLKRLDVSSRQLNGAVEAAIELLDRESMTFEIGEVVDAVVDYLSDNDYFCRDEIPSVEVRHEDSTYIYSQYWNDVTSIDTKYVTPCKPCSPCAPGAGDLGSCTDDGVDGFLAHCPAPSDWEGWKQVYEIKEDGSLNRVAGKESP